MSRFTSFAAAAAAVALVGVCPGAQAQPEPALADIEPTRLENMVLDCDLDAPEGRDLTPEIAFCAAAADELRQRRFGGDHGRLLGWWRDERAFSAGDCGDPMPEPLASPETTPAVAPAAAPAEPEDAKTLLGRVPPEQLKATYLHCDRLAQTSLLDFGTAAGCSMVYEELKQRVFGGDFEQLLAWSRQQVTTPVASESMAPETP